MNPEKWEDSDTMDSNSGVMVSNLPLIFARGEPVSLSKMTLDELQVFVPFMVSCSIGEDPKIDWSQLRRPQWWPNKQPFRLPSASKSRMVQLVVDCYTFHGCQYLLQFCATLHQMKPAGGYKFTDNRDGTTSMYNGHNGKLLVTFRNENREYDLVHQKTKNQSSTQKKRLLSNLPLNKKKSDAMVQPPNVYLCDKCDDEFLSFREVQAHEKHCKGNSPSTPPLPSPEPEDHEEVLDPAEQVPFLSYFGLQPAKHTGIEPYTSPRKRQQSLTPVKKFYNHSYLLDISSPMGKYILSRTKYGGRLQMPEHFVARYERHIMRSSDADLVNLRERGSSSRWIVVYRQRKEQQWVHTYCFNSKQKREKILAVQTGLDRRSRMLLASCQRVQLRVKLKRLAKKVVDRYTRRGGSGVHVPCIDLTGVEDNHDWPVRQPSSAPSSSSLSTMFYHSPADKCLPNVNSSNINYFPNDTAVAGSLVYYSPLVPSATDIDNPSKYECMENSNIGGTLTDPLCIDENYFGDYHNSFSGKFAPSVSSLSLTKNENPTEGGNSLSGGVLPFLSKNTQNKINALSNNGVTVTSLNCNFLQSDSSSLNIFNSAKSNVHRANSKSSSTPVKYKLSRNNFSSSSASNNYNDRDNDTRNVSNNSYSNHSRSSNITSSGITNASAENSNNLLNKNHKEVNLVEVIELSSDDDDSLAQDKRSYARSKNGDSHWPLKELSFISGRNKRSLMSNGVTQDSVLPPPSYFLSSTSDKPFLSSSFFHPSNIPNYINGENGRNVFPPLTVDSEGVIKAPLKVDEEVTFNIPLSNQTNNGYVNNLLKYYNPDDNDKIVMNNNNNKNNCNQYSNSILSSLASKVNKGLQYLTTFVKSKVYENSIPSNNNNNNSNTSNYNYHHQNREIDKTFDMVDEGGTENSQSTTIKRSREMVSLLNDECRELKRRGIEMLEQLDDKRIMTRCNAEKTLNQMFAFNEDKYLDLPSDFAELRENDSNEVLDENIFCSSNPVNHINDTKNCEISFPKDRSCNITANGIHDKNTLPLTIGSHFSISTSLLHKEDFDEKNYHTPIRVVKEKKKTKKICRELINLARDECKELRGMGFHPADLLGSSEGHTPVILEQNEPTASSKARSSFLSYKHLSKKSVAENPRFDSGSSVKKMMQGNKKLSRELSKLIKDEWKELKRVNAHPSQIKNLLSSERNVRSNSSYKRNKLTMMKRVNSNRGKTTFWKNLRGQDTSATETRIENPRLSQRKLIHSENGMCVVSYSVGDMTIFG